MKKTFLITTLLAMSLHAALPMGKVLPLASLSGQKGGYLSGKAWNSSMLKGKTTLLIYADPDEQETGKKFAPLIDTLESKLNPRQFQVVMIMNLGATWKPTFLIEKLSGKIAGKYPKRIFVLDKKSLLTQKWGLKNNAYDVLVIDKKARLRYSHSGVLTSKDMKTIESTIQTLMQ